MPAPPSPLKCRIAGTVHTTPSTSTVMLLPIRTKNDITCLAPIKLRLYKVASQTQKRCRMDDDDDDDATTSTLAKRFHMEKSLKRRNEDRLSREPAKRRRTDYFWVPPLESKEPREGRDMVPARTAVMNTTEMLEAILLQLPMADLLRAQRVSKRFNRVIKASILLQQNLFMQPRPSFKVCSTVTLSLHTKTQPGPTDQPEINVLALDYLHRHNVIFARDCHYICGCPNEPKSHKLTKVAGGMSTIDMQGSWRRMLLSQDPLQLCCLGLSFGNTDASHGETFVSVQRIRYKDCTETWEKRLYLEDIMRLVSTGLHTFLKDVSTDYALCLRYDTDGDEEDYEWLADEAWKPRKTCWRDCHDFYPRAVTELPGKEDRLPFVW